jgi:cyclopropane fatty-acyl-phospholipid synthase-like methyltransferase
MKRRDFLTAGLALAAQGCSTPGLNLDVPYVPTPQPVVDAMLRLASVRHDDIVYDLGCGDGRIVITAAREFGARGVGIDIDPRRIGEANAAARRAGVSGRVRFVVQDLFSADFSEATVMMLYLLPELNAKLLPKIRADLRPGARVVSHQFHMGDWQPERIETAWSGNRDHALFLWVVPPR